MPCAPLRAKLDFMRSTMDAIESNSLLLPKGVCYVLFAYDAARSINLDAAERRVHEATQRQTIEHKRRAPAYLESLLDRIEAFCRGSYHPKKESLTLLHVSVIKQVNSSTASSSAGC